MASSGEALKIWKGKVPDGHVGGNKGDAGQRRKNPQRKKTMVGKSRLGKKDQKENKKDRKLKEGRLSRKKGQPSVKEQATGKRLDRGDR